MNTEDQIQGSEYGTDGLRPYDEFSDFFNDGYNLSKNNPGLFEETLWDTRDNAERHRAMSLGQWLQEYEREQEKEIAKEKDKRTLSEIRAVRQRTQEPSVRRHSEKSPDDNVRRPGFLRGSIDELRRPMREMYVARRDASRYDQEREFQ